MGIHSGVVGSEKVNFYKAQQVGVAGLSRLVGTTFGEASFKRKDKVTRTLKVGDKEIAVNKLTLYHRMCIAKGNQEDFKEYLSNEVAP